MTSPKVLLNYDFDPSEGVAPRFGRVTHVELIEWLVTDYGFDKREALQVVSQVGTMRVGNAWTPITDIHFGFHDVFQRRRKWNRFRRAQSTSGLL